jgi:ankyrin repeat protein
MLKGYVGWVLDHTVGPALAERDLDGQLLRAVEENNEQTALDLLHGCEDPQVLVYADMNAQEEEGVYQGWSVLHIAAFLGEEAIVALLLHQGVDADVVITMGPHEGMSAGELAAGQGHRKVEEMVQEYLDHQREATSEL